MSRTRLPSARVDTERGARIELMDAFYCDSFSNAINNLSNSSFVHPDMKDALRLAYNIIYQIQEDPACYPAIQAAVDWFNKQEGRTPISDPAKCEHKNRGRSLSSHNHGNYVTENCRDCRKLSLRKEKVNIDYQLTKDKVKLKEFLDAYVYSED
jgi:hypothetical protein